MAKPQKPNKSPPSHHSNNPGKFKKGSDPVSQHNLPYHSPAKINTKSITLHFGKIDEDNKFAHFYTYYTVTRTGTPKQGSIHLPIFTERIETDSSFRESLSIIGIFTRTNPDGTAKPSNPTWQGTTKYYSNQFVVYIGNKTTAQIEHLKTKIHQAITETLVNETDHIQNAQVTYLRDPNLPLNSNPSYAEVFLLNDLVPIFQNYLVIDEIQQKSPAEIIAEDDKDFLDLLREVFEKEPNDPLLITAIQNMWNQS